jgi:hypothetical protein
MTDHKWSHDRPTTGRLWAVLAPPRRASHVVGVVPGSIAPSNETAARRGWTPRSGRPSRRFVEASPTVAQAADGLA